MTVDDYFDAERALWARFGLEPLGYPVFDFRGHPWANLSGEICVANPGPYEDPDEVSEYAEYSGNIYGTSLWEAEPFTLVVVCENGSKEAWLLTSSAKVG